MKKLERSTVLRAGLALALGIGAASCQTALAADDGANQAPKTAQNQTVPGTNPNESLSKQLNQSNGVITPPPTRDSGIHTTAPDPDPGTTPVIPPPGSPGSNSNVQPK